MRLTILHTNDIHGRQERIAQIATIVRDVRATSDHPVLYLDGGDVEETTRRLSNITKGIAMHRLLGRAGCDAATVGNASWLRYGPGILKEQAEAVSYPLLLANFEPVDGPVASAMLGDVGVLGLTAPFTGLFGGVDWGFVARDELEVARREAATLRARGAALVILLSHLGLDVDFEGWDDRRLAAELQGEVDLIIGAHTHDLLPAGEWVGGVLIAQAGEFGEHVGRIDIEGASITATVMRVGDDVEPHPDVVAEVRAIEAEASVLLAEQVGELTEPLDAHWIADMLRVRMGADAGLFAEGLVLDVLPPGPLTRGALWSASETPANPGITTMTGAQLLDLLHRGNDPGFMQETPRPLRGRARGGLRLAGLDEREIQPGKTYTVAGSDWELDTFGGYPDPAWRLETRYDFPIIIREAIEEHLRSRR